MGLKGDDLLRFYRERGPVIFPIMRLHRKWRRELRHIIKPKHSQDVLFKELQNAYFPTGEVKPLGSSNCRLLIPAFDAVSGICHTFRTPHHPLLEVDAATNAAEVALATAAAPTYFSAARVRNMVANASYFDGGVWANCPALAAIIEAVCYLDVPLDRIDVLSIGTTEEPFTVKSMTQSGIVGWGRTLLSLLMSAQVDSVVDHAKKLVTEARFLRINTTTNPGLYKLDKAAEIESLITLGNKRATDPTILYQVKSRFLNGVPTMDWKTHS